MSLECTVVTTLITNSKPILFCPTCKQAYVIFKRKHVCNPLVKCNTNPITYFEKKVAELEVIPDVPSDYRVPEIDCEKCEQEKKSASDARKATCPECEYNGWYKHSDDKLCPMCVAKRNTPTPPPKIRKVKNTETANKIVGSMPRKRISLRVKVDATGLSPNTGIPTSVTIYETETSDFDWFVRTYTWKLPECENNILDTVASIIEYFTGLTTQYTWTWEKTDNNYRWLRWLIAKYYPLCVHVINSK